MFLDDAIVDEVKRDRCEYFAYLIDRVIGADPLLTRDGNMRTWITFIHLFLFILPFYYRFDRRLIQSILLTESIKEKSSVALRIEIAYSIMQIT